MSTLPPILHNAIEAMVYGQRLQATGSEAEAKIDRLQAALDLESRLRETMSLAFDRATEDLKAAEAKLAKRDDFLIQLRDALASGEACDDTVWLDRHTTMLEAINIHLDDPQARGEQPLPLDMAS